MLPKMNNRIVIILMGVPDMETHELVECISELKAKVSARGFQFSQELDEPDTEFMRWLKETPFPSAQPHFSA